MAAPTQTKYILLASRSVISNTPCKLMLNSYVRNMSSKRDKLYGVEEGHAEQKNEVRKEKFWRKRNPSRKGAFWRETNGYDTRNALSHGAFAMIPDWSDENGDAGAPTPLQEKIRQYELTLIQQIYDASMIVQKAKEFEQSENKESDGLDNNEQ